MKIFFQMTTARKLDIVLENNPETRNFPKFSIFVEFWRPAGGLFWPAFARSTPCSTHGSGVEVPELGAGGRR